MSPRQIVIAGGGIGGLSCARRLQRRVESDDRVIVIDPREEFVFAPGNLWVLAGTRRPRQLTRPMARMVPRGVDHRRERVLSFDADAKKVTTTAGEIAYEKLVVALGAEQAPDLLPGFSEAALDLFTVEGAAAGREALSTVRAGRVAVVVSRLPYKCPAAPYEAAFIADAALRRAGVRDEVSVDVFTPEALPMPTAGAAMGHRVAAMLADREIGFHPTTTVESISHESRTLRTASGNDVAYDVLLGIPAHRPPEALADSALAGPSGYAPVDPETLASTAHDDVYIIGDAAAVPIPDGKFLPKAGVFAHAEATIVAERIARELRGQAPSHCFDSKGSCFVETGGGRAAYATGDFGSSPPDLRMYRPAPWWHLAKVAVEQYWLHPWMWR